MSLLLLLITGAAAFWLWNRHGETALRLWHRHGPRADNAGASAAARARQLRTPLVRLADLLGISTAAGREATRYDTAARSERRARDRLRPLLREGWALLYDRRLPRGRANVDGIAISPRGAVFLLDPKHWDRRFPLTVRAGRLWHGTRDVSNRFNGVEHETRTVAQLLGVPVVPIVAMDGAPLRGPDGQPARELTFRGVRIVPGDRLPDVLRASARIPGQRRPAELTSAAESALPRYTRR